MDKFSAEEVRRYTFRVLERVTDKFSEEQKLSEGVFGAVFRGILRGGKEIAVKRLINQSARLPDEGQFESEVTTLQRMQHENVTKLEGYCYETTELAANSDTDGEACHVVTERLLCYELPKGRRLDTLLPFGSTCSEQGTEGHMAPEYLESGMITTKSDIFSLGVLIVEIVTGEKCGGNGSDHSGRSFVENAQQTTTWHPSLEEHFVPEVKGLINMGLWCVKEKPEDRPTIDQIIHLLLETEAQRPATTRRLSMRRLDYGATRRSSLADVSRQNPAEISGSGVRPAQRAANRGRNDSGPKPRPDRPAMRNRIGVHFSPKIIQR
ncbi:hypothetical protein BS78_09G049100 [Paspalum vaginatum]|nr:hypothetical protein BS78_09G049100 [Paspalum vaginatum]